MTWLVEKQPSQQELAATFRRLMTEQPILQLPGAYDGLSAQIAKQVGFPALYLSGAAYTASRGLPDLGIVHSQEVAERARDLIRAAQLPILVDIDTGFGGVIQVARTAKEMVEAGVAAVQIEDQKLPKKCGHLNGKQLVEATEMVAKIGMIKEVAPTLLVIARTDAKDVEGIGSAVDRAQKYLQAGADAIFPEALENEAEFQQFRAALTGPLLANMTEFGKTPYFTAEQFQRWGYEMMIYPVTALRIAAKAYEAIYREILQTGTQANAVSQMQTRQELYETIHYFAYEKLDEQLAQTDLGRLQQRDK